MLSVFRGVAGQYPTWVACGKFNLVSTFRAKKLFQAILLSSFSGTVLRTGPVVYDVYPTRTGMF